MVGYGTPSTYAGQTVSLKVRGAQSPDGELICEDENRRDCATLSTERVLRELESVVKPPKVQDPQRPE